MNRRMRIPDRRFRRRAIVAAVVAVSVLVGAGAAMASVTDNFAMLRPAQAPEPAPVAVTATPTPTVDPRDAGARARLQVDLLGARAVAATPVEQAAPELIAALQAAISAADAALAGTDTDAILRSRTELTTAHRAVETAAAAWSALQVRAAADATAQADAAAEQQAQAEAAKQLKLAAAEAKKQAAAEAKKQAAAAQSSADAKAAPAPVAAPAPQTVPAPVKVVAPVDRPPVPVDPVLAARDANAWFTAALDGIGATGFTISADWATKCKQPDAGERYIQGCARSDDPSIIYMKPVPVDVAASEQARGVVLHEWAHLLQYRLGYPAVVAAADAVFGVGVGLEQSADCMAVALGATGKPGGYTSDCSGARGVLAAALVAGRLA